MGRKKREAAPAQATAQDQAPELADDAQPEAGDVVHTDAGEQLEVQEQVAEDTFKAKKAKAPRYVFKGHTIHGRGTERLEFQKGDEVKGFSESEIRDLLVNGVIEATTK